MESITVRKDELRAKVVANAEQHQAIFDEAVEGYRTKAVQLLEEHIVRIQSGTLIDVTLRLPQPVNHIADYNRVLAMLEMAVGDEITIDEDSFRYYVMDDWSWKREFLRTNSEYSAMGLGQFKALDASPPLFSTREV